MQKIPLRAKERCQQPNSNILLSKDQGIRHPKPPSIPRSQSSKNLQLARPNSTHLRTERRLLHRSYPTPNVGYYENYKLPKTTRNLLKKGQRNYVVNHQKVESIFKGPYIATVPSGIVCNTLDCKRPQTVVDSLANLESSFKGQTLGNECKGHLQTYNNLNCSLCKSLVCDNCMTKEQSCVLCKGTNFKSLKFQTVDDLKSQTFRGEAKGGQTSKGLQDLSYEYRGNNVLNGFRSCRVVETNANIGEELPCVFTKQQKSQSKSDNLYHICPAKQTEKQVKSSEWLDEPISFDTEDIVDLNQNSLSSNHFESAQANKHAVFFIYHNDGRLQPASNLLPLPEETGQQNHPKSPWHCCSNERNLSTNGFLKLTNHDRESNMEQISSSHCLSNDSRIVLNGLHKSANQGAGRQMASQLPWQCYDDMRKFHVVDELFDSDDEGGLVIKPRVEESGLDADKKATIDSWIRDVTLNTSTPNI